MRSTRMSSSQAHRGSICFQGTFKKTYWPWPISTDKLSSEQFSDWSQRWYFTAPCGSVLRPAEDDNGHMSTIYLRCRNVSFVPFNHYFCFFLALDFFQNSDFNLRNQKSDFWENFRILTKILILNSELLRKRRNPDIKVKFLRKTLILEFWKKVRTSK